MTEIPKESAQTLRDRDKSGNLKPHHKSAKGYRYYTQYDLDILLCIKSQNKKTVKFTEISTKPQKSENQKIKSVDYNTEYLKNILKTRKEKVTVKHNIVKSEKKLLKTTHKLTNVLHSVTS